MKKRKSQDGAKLPPKKLFVTKKRDHSVIMLGGPKPQKPRTHTAEDFYKAVQSAREDSHLFHDTGYISEELMEYEKINKHCEVHHSEMEKKDIPILFGEAFFPRNYQEDREKDFPNCGDPELGGCCPPLPGQRTKSKMWICTLCVKAREEWVKERGYKDF